MKKIMQRLLVFCIGVPLIVLLVLFLPHFHHIALNIIVVICTALGALEFAAMLEKKQLAIPKIEALVLGALVPAAGTLAVSFNCDENIVRIIFMAGALWVLLSRIFSRSAGLDTFLNRVAAGFGTLVYPGVFMYWLVKMSAWENAGVIILVFLLIPIGNDSAAWAAGMLFGKNNRGIVPASPNKSTAGFVGGILGSIIVSTGAALIVPRFFIPRFDILPSIPPAPPSIPPALIPAITLGILTGFAAMLGDLAESAIKRSAGFKDSGTIMLGRGGMLDSIDSIAVSAPVFYLVFSLLFKQF
ncbi:phosphatidate cytidylyltransferase [Spirochaetia bacterium]|nr:phosphatidate cytidylyltransferase [Spirochaetia bacterium]